jgi:hypothetical protein
LQGVTTGEDINFAFKAIIPGDGIQLASDGQSITITATHTDDTLARVAYTGSYQDLIDLPNLAKVATSGNYLDLINQPQLSTVAFTGRYTDLLNLPTILPQVNSDWLATTGTAQILNKPILAAVATSGAYNDLTGRPNLATVATTGSYNDLSDTPPIIPQVNSDWNATTGIAKILNKPNLATVATTGSYADLTNTPAPYELPIASTTQLGGVMLSNQFAVDETGVITIAAGFGSVKSVAMAMPSIFSVQGSPVTSTGTLTAVLLGQPANTVFAGPASGSADIPAFRQLTGADLPAATKTSLGTVYVPASSGLTIGTDGAIGFNVNSLVSSTTGYFVVDSPVFNGTPTAVNTPATSDNSNALATTAFVKSALTAFNLPPATATSIGGVIVANPDFSGLTVDASGNLAANVISFMDRTGKVRVQGSDLVNPGNGLFIVDSPVFNGTPSAVNTPIITDNSGNLATTAFVHNLVNASGVATFNGRTGQVTLGWGDLTPLGVAPLDSPVFTGNASAVTQANADSSTLLATTAFVHNLVNASGVATFNGRNGVVTLQASDLVDGTGRFLLQSPNIVGTATVATPTTGDNSNAIANTAFVQNTLNSVAVTSVAGKTGAVTLDYTNISGAAPINSPVFTGLPSTDGVTPFLLDQIDHTLATTQWVYEALSSAQTVDVHTWNPIPAKYYNSPILNLVGNLVVDTTVTLPSSGRWVIVNNAGPSNLTLSCGTGPTLQMVPGAFYDIVADGGIYIAGQMGVTRPFNDNTTYLATTEFVQTALGNLQTGVTSFNTRTGIIVLQPSDLQKTDGSGDFLLDSASFKGVPTAPTATFGTNTTQIATTQFVTTNFAPLASPALTGVPTAPTPARGDDSTTLATTHFLQRYMSSIVTVDVSDVSHGTTFTLTPAQYGTEIIQFIGVMTASVIINMPASGQWIMYNNTNGDFTVTLSNGGGATYVVPQNESASVLSQTGLGIINSNVAGAVFTPATVSTLGGVIVPNGGGITVDANGNIGVAAGSASNLGGVKQGAGVTIAADGSLSANVTTVAGRTGDVVLAVADVTGAAPLASPALTGTPTAPTQAANDNSTNIATTAFVKSAISGASVTSFNTRTGAITLQASDITSAGGALTASPTFTGAVTLPVPPTYTASDLHAATTSFAYQAGQGVTQVSIAGLVGTQSFALTPEQYRFPVIEITGAPNDTNVVVTFPASGHWWVYSTVDTRTLGYYVTVKGQTSTSYALTAGQWYEFVADGAANTGLLLVNQSGGNGINAVTSFNARQGAVTLTASDVNTALTYTAANAATTAPLASPAFTGTPTAPTATAGTNTTQVATTAFVQAALPNTSIFAPKASPTFTGVATIPAAVYGVTSLGNVSGTVTMDLTTSSQWTMTITGATTFAFSNPPASGSWEVAYLRLTNAGSATITWPTSTKFSAGTAPTLTAAGVDLLGVFYDTVTSTYMIFVIGLNIQ